MKRVAVLMSGGVDSSVAAALLLQQGYDVTGFTMELGHAHSPQIPGEACPAAVECASRVARKLGIPHQVVDLSEQFAEEIIHPFEESYRQGVTPNPCIRCNRTMKFGRMLQEACRLGARAVATGHYARIEGNDSTFSLRRAMDSKKDQSYFLYAIGKENLPRILFPLGNFHKAETRQIAAHMELPTAQVESQDVCFMAGKDYRARLSKGGIPGPIRDRAGRVLGQHSGIENFTVGQRKGIRLGGGPYYVLRLEPATHTVIVGSQEEGRQLSLEAHQAAWLEPVRPGQRVAAKIRSRHAPCPAIVESVSDSSFRLRFEEPQWAITPGQSAVLYEDDLVLGGGVIASAD